MPFSCSRNLRVCMEGREGRGEHQSCLAACLGAAARTYVPGKNEPRAPKRRPAIEAFLALVQDQLLPAALHHQRCVLLRVALDHGATGAVWGAVGCVWGRGGQRGMDGWMDAGWALARRGTRHRGQRHAACYALDVMGGWGKLVVCALDRTLGDRVGGPASRGP